MIIGEREKKELVCVLSFLFKFPPMLSVVGYDCMERVWLPNQWHCVQMKEVFPYLML